MDDTINWRDTTEAADARLETLEWKGHRQGTSPQPTDQLWLGAFTGITDCDFFPFLVSFLLPGSVLRSPGIILGPGNAHKG